jgi:hypothetical protein
MAPVVAIHVGPVNSRSVHLGEQAAERR